MKLAVSGIVIFVLGIVVGYQLNIGMISSIQGYLFNLANDVETDATDANATDANATDANATDANATDANATDANATDANVSSTDNIIYLQTFLLSKKSVVAGDKVNVTITTSGAKNTAASIVFKNNTTGATFTAKVEGIGSNQAYITIPSSAVATTYTVTDVLLVGKNSDNKTFTKQYSLTGTNKFAFNSTLIVTKKELDEEDLSSKIILNSISLQSTSVKVSDKVYLNVNASEKLSGLKLVFASADNKTFTVYAKDLESNPYIEIPSSAIAGTYTLTNVILTSSNGSTVYSNTGGIDTEKLTFNLVLEIIDGTDNTFIYNNEDVSSDVITKLYNAPSGTEITINADSNTLINEELFNVIKGNDKKLTINYKGNQIIFNGKDITTSKTIDISMIVGTVSSNEMISKLVSNGIIVNFPDNGNLPGKALVRIKATEEISSILKDNVYVYIYNESTNNFSEIDTNVKKTSDEYYEFAITHNSDYLIVNEKLDSKLVVSESDGNVVAFQKGNKTYLILISVAIVIIVAVSVLIFVLKKKKMSDCSNTKDTSIDNDKDVSKENN